MFGAQVYYSKNADVLDKDLESYILNCEKLSEKSVDETMAMTEAVNRKLLNLGFKEISK